VRALGAKLDLSGVFKAADTINNFKPFHRTVGQFAEGKNFHALSMQDRKKSCGTPKNTLKSARYAFLFFLLFFYSYEIIHDVFRPSFMVDPIVQFNCRGHFLFIPFRSFENAARVLCRAKRRYEMFFSPLAHL
jgi:hypothetical protein